MMSNGKIDMVVVYKIDRLEIEPKVDGIKALLKDVGVEVK